MANAIVSINTLMDDTTKAVTASITLACNGTFTDCGDTMDFAWAGNPGLKKPVGLDLTIAAAAECATGVSRPLMSSTLSNLTNNHIIRMWYENVSLARSLAARTKPGSKGEGNARGRWCLLVGASLVSRTGR